MAKKAQPSDNHLIGALPLEVQQRIFPKLKLLKLPLGSMLYDAGQSEHYVYFPVDCIISLVYFMLDGHSAEISVVGNEGLVGIAVFMGGESTPSQAIAQIGGSVWRLPAPEFRKEFNAVPEMRLVILRYTQALITQMAQTVVCNRHHSIDQQLCRWLLLCLDRMPGKALTMTQEFIATMLGVRRESVTVAAGKLQDTGAIRYQRGRIRVLDRAQLEKLCCECYAVVRQESDRLAL